MFSKKRKSVASSKRESVVLMPLVPLKPSESRPPENMFLSTCDLLVDVCVCRFGRDSSGYLDYVGDGVI